MNYTNEPAWGIIPLFLSEHDPRSAREQLDNNYAHGGGFRPLAGWTLDHFNNTFTITYPGDATLHPIGRTRLRNERLFLYPSAWLAIVQPDLSFVVARID